MLDAFFKWLEALLAPVAAKPVPEKKDMPWRLWLLIRDGWGETSPGYQSQAIVKGWLLSKYCKSYKSLIGADKAWCGIGLALAMHESGYAFPEQCETAKEWIGYGTPIDWEKDGIPQGAVVVVKGDSYHVTTANRDHKPGEKYVEVLGCNQDNKICVKRDDRRVVYVGWPVKKEKS